MGKLWIFNRSEHRFGVLVMMIFMVCQNLVLCWSLNDEGLALLRLRERVVSDPFGALSNWNDGVGEVDPCSWFGVECSDGNVVVLNLKDLCLGGTLAPELGNLVHIKSIILRNNSFSGIIPEVIGELKELEELDLGCNNFSGSLPSSLGNNRSLATLLLDENGLLGNISPEIHALVMLSRVNVDENHLSNTAKRLSCNRKLITQNIAQTEDIVHRRLLQAEEARSVSPLPSPSPSPSPSIESPSSSPSSSHSPSHLPMPPSLSAPTPPPSENPKTSIKSSSSNIAFILVGAIGGSAFLVILVIVIFYCKSKRLVTVKPWKTGLSGQLQKAFVTGVPKLKRSELEAGCEDFSNVIGSSSNGTLYKGTLSNGVEIAVTSVEVKSSLDWSENSELQFRRKISTLSKINHKNFVNLLGFCEEEEPFTRMMVFEYAPNGTLFEHLHIKEAEHLDWEMRLRIAMGMAYCLDHVHQLNPPITHKNLHSSSINLTEDYAAKISDLGLWNGIAEAQKGTSRLDLSDIPPVGPESNVYSFGVILFEIVTGRVPYSVQNGSSLEDWASEYLNGDKPLKDMVDPTLKSFKEEQLEGINGVIKFCVRPDPYERPTMREITATLREITGITPDGAIPKLSPLWWAELEILSDAS